MNEKYYLVKDSYNGKYEIRKKQNKEVNGVLLDGLIATFTCPIHADLALEMFNR